MSRVIRTLTDSNKSDCLFNFYTYFRLESRIHDTCGPTRNLRRNLVHWDSRFHFGLHGNCFHASPMYMSSHMYFECTGPHKGLATMCALEWSVTRMPSQMICQVPLSSESFFTARNRASKGLLSWMYSQMSLQITLLSECFSASDNRTYKWFFASLKLS